MAPHLATAKVKITSDGQTFLCHNLGINRIHKGTSFGLVDCVINENLVKETISWIGK